MPKRISFFISTLIIFSLFPVLPSQPPQSSFPRQDRPRAMTQALRLPVLEQGRMGRFRQALHGPILVFLIMVMERLQIN